jgi:hypothetical protein
VVVVVGCVDENDCGGGDCLELSREQGLLSKCERGLHVSECLTEDGGRRKAHSHKATQESLN